MANKNTSNTGNLPSHDETLFGKTKSPTIAKLIIARLYKKLLRSTKRSSNM